jgi:hypothetical protein
MSETAIPAISSEEEIGFMNVDRTDYSSFDTPQKIRHLEVEGYLVLPDLIDKGTIAKIKSELANMPMKSKDYSEHQTYATDQPQWVSRTAAEVIGHPLLIEFLTDLMGPEIIFTRGFFQRTHPGSPGISMHTDGQPHGSSIFDWEGSSPRLLRVLFYLDDLIPDRAPFRVIPRSHLSYHSQGNPYLRYKSHPEEVTLCVDAGSVILVHAHLFHGTHPNKDAAPRELVQFGYRPAWANPIQPMKEWDPQLVANAPEQAKPFLKSLNSSGASWQLDNKPRGMPTRAAGINPSRWGDAGAAR